MDSIISAMELPGRGRAILWGVVLIMSFFIFFIVFRGQPDDKRDLSISKGNSYMEGVRIVNKKDGVASSIISARKANFSSDESMVRMASVNIEIKKEGAVLNADSGLYNMNTRDLHLQDNIVIHMKDSTITTESLSWNPAVQKLSSSGRILMQGDKFRIEGEGLTATEDDKVTLSRDVKAIFF